MAVALDTVDALRLAAGFVVLAYASYTDLVARRVVNEVWLVTAGLGLAAIAADAALGRLLWPWWLGALGIVVLAYLLWRFRLLYGGADAKAVMALSLLLPYAPGVHAAAWDLPRGEALLPTALTALMNGVLVLALLPVVLALYNLARGHVALPAMFVGRRMALEEAAERPVWIMERAEEQRVRLSVFPRRDLDPQENAARLHELGVKEVWVTPKVPFMVPLAAGYLLALGVGDIVFQVVGRAMGMGP